VAARQQKATTTEGQEKKLEVDFVAFVTPHAVTGRLWR
jgi:hypothetical protein